MGGNGTAETYGAAMTRRTEEFTSTPSSTYAERSCDRRRRGPFPVLIWLAAVLFGLVAFTPGAKAGSGIAVSQLFDGLVELRVDGYLEIPKWDDVHRQLAAQQNQVQDCRDGGQCRSKSAGVLAEVLDRLSTQDRNTQVQEINQLFNRRPYAEDSSQFNAVDKWQLPLDLLDGAGDCEDFAIAKYFALRQLGVPDDELRIVVAQEPRTGAGHAFLTVMIDGREMILDYDVSKPTRKTSVPVRPRFAFNAASRWVFVPNRLARR